MKFDDFQSKFKEFKNVNNKLLLSLSKNCKISTKKSSQLDVAFLQLPLTDVARYTINVFTFLNLKIKKKKKIAIKT